MREPTTESANIEKEMINELASWFDRFLKNDEPVPNMIFHGG